MQLKLLPSGPKLDSGPLPPDPVSQRAFMRRGLAPSVVKVPHLLSGNQKLKCFRCLESLQYTLSLEQLGFCLICRAHRSKIFDLVWGL